MNLRMAQNPGDYRRVKALMREEMMDIDHPLKTPTIMAFDDEDKLIGALATTFQDNMIIAGPLVLESSHRRAFTALRLMEAYENAMRNLKVTTYILPIEQGGVLESMQKKYYPHVAPYAVRNEIMYYTRRLDGSQEALDGSVKN